MSIITEVLASAVTSQANAYINEYVEADKDVRDAFYKGMWAMSGILTGRFIAAGIPGSELGPIMSETIKEMSAKFNQKESE